MKTFFANLSGTYLSPMATARRMKTQVPPDRVLLAYLMFALLISFVARMPALLVSSEKLPNPDTFIGAQIAASLIFGALFMYLLAAVSHLIARVFGGKGSHHAARLALFWVLLAMQPLIVLNAVIGHWGWNAGQNFGVSIVFGAFFLWIWLVFLLEVERP